MGQADPLEEKMATHSSIRAWNGQRRLASYNPWGCKELDGTERLSTDMKSYEIGPTQLPLENIYVKTSSASFSWSTEPIISALHPELLLNVVENQPLKQHMIESLWR